MTSSISRNYPSESETVDAISQHVAQKRWVAVESWKVGVHVRALPVRHLLRKFYFIFSTKNWFEGGSPGLVVMGGDSCSKGREFESRHRILDGHFFTYLFL